MGAVHRSWVNRLAPSGRLDDFRPASGETRAGASQVLSDSAIAWAVETAHAMAAHTIAEIPELGGGEGPFETLRMGTESAVLQAARIVATDDPASPAVTPEGLLGDRDFVRRGISIETVLHGIRLGHRFVASRFLNRCAQVTSPAELPEEMQRISELLFEFFDDYACRMAEEYLSERDRWISSAAAARFETARAILSGEPVDVRTASTTLGYDLTRSHLAMVLWSEEAPTDPAELQRTATHLLRQLGADAVLLVSVGATSLWAWGVLPTEAELDFSGLAPSVHVACGLVEAGVDGFRHSHEQAQEAARVAQLDGSRRLFTDYGSHELLCLLTANLSMARAFLHRELGALAADTESARDLQETLLAYLHEERSVNAAAKRLHVARNTVTYRVKKAESVLGRPIAHRQRELHAALSLIRMLGGPGNHS